MVYQWRLINYNKYTIPGRDVDLGVGCGCVAVELYENALFFLFNFAKTALKKSI